MNSDNLIQWAPPPLVAIPGVAHGVTGRQGGVSEGAFSTLNLGLHVGDDAARVVENRRRAAEALGFPLSATVCAEQVHGAKVAVVSAGDCGRGATDYATALPGVDALVTATPGVLLSLYFADCLPVLFSTADGRAVAIAHAGWRGLTGGVLENTVTTLVQMYGVEPEDILVGIGPGIGPCCFEVGPEVAAQFPASVVHESGGKKKIDLKAAAALRLQGCGIPPQNIASAEDCTYCLPERYFSHRRDAGKTGRMAGMIGTLP
jgi:polyphenol oxidase